MKSSANGVVGVFGWWFGGIVIGVFVAVDELESWAISTEFMWEP